MQKSASEIIEQISGIVKGVWTHSENPELLSKDLNDISVLNWALSQWQADFEEQERTTKAALDLEKANLILQYTNDGDAVNRAEVKVTIETAEMRKEYNKIASALEKMKITARANEKVMDSARTRISLIKGEVKNG